MAKKGNNIKTVIIIFIILAVITSVVLGLYFGLKQNKTYYSCNSGKCVEDSKGTFTTLDNCNSNCNSAPAVSMQMTASEDDMKEEPPRYNCMFSTLLGRNKCVEHPLGEHADLDSCQDNCDNTVYVRTYGYPYYNYPIRRRWWGRRPRRWRPRPHRRRPRSGGRRAGGGGRRPGGGGGRAGGGRAGGGR